MNKRIKTNAIDIPLIKEMLIFCTSTDMFFSELHIDTVGYIYILMCVFPQ